MKRRIISYLGGNVADRSSGEGRRIQGGRVLVLLKEEQEATLGCSEQWVQRVQWWEVRSQSEADFDCTQRVGKPLEGLEQGSNKVVKLCLFFPELWHWENLYSEGRKRWKMLSAGDRLESKFSKER